MDKTVTSPEARSILQDLFVTEADILPDTVNKTLRIRIHGASTPATNRVISKLLAKLNTAEINYPGTELKLYYELAAHTQESGKSVSSQLHIGQVV